MFVEGVNEKLKLSREKKNILQKSAKKAKKNCEFLINLIMFRHFIKQESIRSENILFS